MENKLLHTLKIITVGKHFKMSSGNYHASLEAADVQRSDSGIYNLKLANSRGTNSYKINVLVLGKQLSNSFKISYIWWEIISRNIKTKKK